MTTSAAPLRRHRQRQREGRACITVEVDETGLAAALVAARLLRPEHENDRVEITKALERAIEIWTEFPETRFYTDV